MDRGRRKPITDQELKEALVDLTHRSSPSPWLNVFKPKVEHLPADILSVLDAWAEQDVVPFHALRHEVITGPFWGFDSRAVIALLKAHSSEFGLAAVCSFSPNGYVRESATRNLSTLGEKGLPYLALRTCDWVPQVASLASKAFHDRIHSCSDGSLARCLVTLPVIELHQSEASTLILKEATTRIGFLARFRPKLNQWTYAYLLDAQVLGTDEEGVEVLGEALTSRNQVIERSALKQARTLPTETLLPFYESLWLVTNPEVRSFAVQMADDLGRSDALENALMDRHWRVRNDARFYLKRRGVTDFAERYRNQFPLQSALEGFGEIATDEELNELLPYLDHPTAKLRCAVLKALGRRQPKFIRDAFQQALDDSSGAVIREAVAGLSRIGARIPLDEIEHRLRICDSDRQRWALESAIHLVSRWDSLSLILDLSAKESLLHNTESMWSEWLSGRARKTVPTTPAQLESVIRSFVVVSPLLSESVRQTLESEIRYAQSHLQA